MAFERPSVLACAVLMLGANHTSAFAQATPPASYFSVAVGMSIQPAELGVRSNYGVGFSAGIGTGVAARSSVEVRVGGQLFPEGDAYISPGTCWPEVPCDPPNPSEVRVLTVAADYILFEKTRGLGPTLILGVGYRHISEEPEARPESRPFAEVGAGFSWPVGSTNLGLEGRLQLARASANMPNWTFPIGVNIRFL